MAAVNQTVRCSVSGSSHDAVELIESLLDSVVNVDMCDEEFVDRLLKDAVAISNCCLVCWCMTLADLVSMARLNKFQRQHTFGMNPEQHLDPPSQTAERNGLPHAWAL